MKKSKYNHLACHTVGAKFAKAQRWRDLAEKRDDVHVFDPALGVGVVLAPQPHKLILKD